jgi:integrase/recombinase XerC
MALDFRNHLVKEGRKAATVNNRLAALRSLVDLARTLGLISWKLEVKGLKAETLTDTAGPGFEAILAKIRELGGRAEDPKAARDAALVALMGIMGLRRGEVVRLDLEDYEGERLFILGKGRTDEEPVTVPGEVKAILDRWISHRGTKPGALFTHFRPGNHGERLTDRSVGRLTNELGLGNAHGLRHSSITQALDDNQGDVRKTAKFSRHKNIQTVLKYDDNRQDLGGEIAKGLASRLGEPGAKPGGRSSP